MAGVMQQDTGQGTPYVDIMDLTADLVRAHVSKSDVPPEMLRTLILEVHGTLRALSEPQPTGASGPIPMSPGAVLASPEDRAAVVATAYASRAAQVPTETGTNAAQPVRSERPTEPALPASLAPEILEGAARRTRAVNVPAPLPALPDEDEPAVPLNLSVTPDAVIDLAGGKPHGNLGRFIADARGEDPETYRRRFGLPKEYPLMAPRLIRTRGRVSELDPITFRRLSSGPVERDARFDGNPKNS